MSRIFAAAAALVFFAVFFAAPLYAAMTICTMPCCQQSAACETACSIGAGNAATTAARTVVPQDRRVEIATPVVAELLAASDMRAVPVVRDAGGIHPPNAASLHLLNSIFRI